MIDIGQDIRKILNDLLVDVVAPEIEKTFRAQGHNLTGKLIRSIEVQVNQTGGGVFLVTTGNVLYEEYGRFVETGVKSNRIPYGRKTGKKVSKYIQGLIGYFEKRGLSGREAKSAAFATAKVHAREGMPTKASRRFSSTGERTGFTLRASEASEPRFIQLFENKAESVIALRIEQPFRDLAKIFGD